MENLTVSQAMIKVAELEKVYRNKLYTLSDIDNCTTTYILESDNQKHVCNEIFNFNGEFELVMDLSKEIDMLKTEIAKSNNTVCIDALGQSMTIQGALNKSRTMRNQKDTFETILNNAKASKSRKVDAAATSAYYKVTELNFDRKELQDLVDKMNDDLLELEFAINKANNEIVITIA